MAITVQIPDRDAQYLTRTLCELVKIPSRSNAAGGEEQAVQRFFAREAAESGRSVTTFEPDDVPGFREHRLCHGPHRQYGGRKTVLAEAGPVGAPTLMVLAHSDTVEIARPNEWRFDPFCGEVTGTHVRGLGSTDDKWGLAVLLTVMRQVADRNGGLKKRVVFASSIDEESGVCNGTLLLELFGVAADCVLYVDGRASQVCVGNLGGSNLYLTPNRPMKRSQIEGIQERLTHVCNTTSGLRSRLFDSQYFADNMVRSESVLLRSDPKAPGRFTIHFYTLPDEPREEVEGWLRASVEDALRPHLTDYEWSFREPWFEASLIPWEPRLLSILREAVQVNSGSPAIVTTISKQDGFVFNRYCNIPCISYGVAPPSGMGSSHEPNEALPLQALYEGYLTVLQTVTRWLEVDEI